MCQTNLHYVQCSLFSSKLLLRGRGECLYCTKRSANHTFLSCSYDGFLEKKIYIFISFSCHVTSQVVLVDEKEHFSMPMIMKKGKAFIMFMF